jgi:hypothetical protein
VSTGRRTLSAGTVGDVGRRAIPGETDLATTHPELAAQLVDQSLATQLTAGSGRKVEWRCDQGHEWDAAVSPRTDSRLTGCPYCSGRRAIPGETDLATAHPDLAAQLVDQTLATQLAAGSNRKVNWFGACGHEWPATVHSRVSGRGCPYCSGRLVLVGFNDLGTTHPAIAAELVDQAQALAVSAGSHSLVTWRSSGCGHIWESPVKERIRRPACPYCSGRRCLAGFNDLATTHPDLAEQLVDKGIATRITYGSRTPVDWRYPCGHVSTTTANNRSRGRDCPVCSGKQVLVGFNDLATTHPDLAAELVDGSLGHQLTFGSKRLVRWRCNLGHEWTAKPNDRSSQDQGCPYCSNRRVLVGFNDLVTTHPKLAAELVDPSLAISLTFGSGRKVRWRGQCGHEWSASVVSRVSGRGCPECSIGGFSSVSPGWVYLLATPGRAVYKFGISNFLDDRLDLHARQGFTEVVETIYFDVGADAAEVERRIKAHVKAQGWQPPMTAESMPYGGATETLSVHDVGEGFTLTAFLAD